MYRKKKLSGARKHLVLYLDWYKTSTEISTYYTKKLAPFSYQNDLRRACFICSNLSVSMADIKVFLLTHQKAWWSPTCYLHCQNSTPLYQSIKFCNLSLLFWPGLVQEKPVTTILLIFNKQSVKKGRSNILNNVKKNHIQALHQNQFPAPHAPCS